MKKLLSLALVSAVLAYSPSVSAATEIDINPGDAGPADGGSAQFTLLAGNPFTGTDPLDAFIQRRVVAAGEYIDNYIFQIGPVVPGNQGIGLGSGSITYSFSGAPGATFSSINFFNGISNFAVPVTPNGGSIGNIPVFSGLQNILTVNWTTTGAANYAGTINYVPGGIPEPLTWAMMIIGFAAIGFAMRRRKQEVARVRYAF
ncbi:FxDxF family PEP-CTERM protein [Erythrobacter sp.]|uniref:FxDxF family PEP-CTERM protein n=1 Tax=Erythrobacter sp. TaxID=1042 RepID=UPI0025F3C28D|nr:FxDxF family PEP-CTERM protein [Erythrobacter sp.]